MHGSNVWPGNTRLYIGQMLKIGCYRVQHLFVYCCNVTVDVTTTPRGARKAQSKVELNGRPVGLWPYHFFGRRVKKSSPAFDTRGYMCSKSSWLTAGIGPAQLKSV